MQVVSKTTLVLLSVTSAIAAHATSYSDNRQSVSAATAVLLSAVVTIAFCASSASTSFVYCPAVNTCWLHTMWIVKRWDKIQFLSAIPVTNVVELPAVNFAKPGIKRFLHSTMFHEINIWFVGHQYP